MKDFFINATVKLPGRIWYFISVLAGGFVTAIMVNLLKKNNMDDAVVKAVEEDDLDEITFDDL